MQVLLLVLPVMKENVADQFQKLKSSIFNKLWNEQL